VLYTFCHASTWMLFCPWDVQPFMSVPCTLQLLKCGDVVLWEVLNPDRFQVHLFRAGLHETDAALRETLPGGSRCGPFYSGRGFTVGALLFYSLLCAANSAAEGVLVTYC
jgi:hypothetical protein